MHFNFNNILIGHGFQQRKTQLSIHTRLYTALKKAIIARSLPEKTKLPPTRVLAKDLNISRSTVLKAYDLLLVEKYLYSVAGSGYYVAASKNKKLQYHFNSQIPEGGYPKLSKKGISFNRNHTNINNRSNEGIAFRPGLPPLDIFPVKQWKSLSNEYWSKASYSQLSYSSTTGIQCLKENIAEYLKIYRNIDCNTDQIVITSGSLHSLYLVAEALVDKNDEVVLENPIYPRAHNLFRSLKASIHYGEVDKQGIVLDDIHPKNPKLIFTTPSNQYISGVKMSIKRRLELLEWASTYDTFIIEDDYDHEFSNWENPVSSIFSLDRQERVIYLGTFNKLLHPSIRLGYMIVPYYLLDTVTAIFAQSSRFVSTSLQKTLSKFIEKDYLNKHLRNVIEVSTQRKEIFVEHFNKFFQSDFQLESNPLGLHIIAKSVNNSGDSLLVSHLAQKNVIAHPYSKYFIGTAPRTGLVMGYASVNEKSIIKRLNSMKDVLKE